MGGREAIHFITQGRTAAHASLDKGDGSRLTDHLAGFARRATWRCGNAIDLKQTIRCSLTLPLTDLPTLAALLIPMKSLLRANYCHPGTDDMSGSLCAMPLWQSMQVFWPVNRKR